MPCNMEGQGISPVTSWYSRCCCCCTAAAAFGVLLGLPFNVSARPKLPKAICFEIGFVLRDEEMRRRTMSMRIDQLDSRRYEEVTERCLGLGLSWLGNNRETREQPLNLAKSQIFLRSDLFWCNNLLNYLVV